MNIKTTKRIQKVMIITLCWTLFTSFMFINQYYFVSDLLVLKKLSGIYDPWPDLLGTIILGILGGVSGGYILIFKMETKYKKKSFTFGIINSGFLFILFYLGLALFGLLLMNIVYFLFQTGFYNAVIRAWNNLLVNVETPSFFVTMCLWAFLVSVTQFMLQVSDKFGPGILWKFITGKYYHPREEERIFMFLDLKSSTTIAEKIGHKKFFNLLKEIFNDITESIINSQGEIYQYVGDEVIVTWPVEKGLKEKLIIAFYVSIEYNRLLKKSKITIWKDIVLCRHLRRGSMSGKQLSVK